MSTTRRGFTVPELLIVMIIIGMLATIALLRYIDLKHQARSSQVVSDLRAVRLATYNYWSDKQQWPGDAGSGITPPELESYLGDRIPFTNEYYTFDFDNTAPPGPGREVSVRVTSSDTKLMEVLGRLVGSQSPFYMVGNTLTFVIVGPDGRM